MTQTKEMVELQEQLDPQVAHAQALVIDDLQDLVHAVGVVKGFKGIRKQIEQTFDEHIAAAHKNHKGLLATKKQFTEPLDDAEDTIKFKVGKYCEGFPDMKTAVPGMTVRADKVVIGPSPNDQAASLVKIAALVTKTKLPIKLLKIDTRIVKDLLDMGMTVPGYSLAERPTVVIRGE